MSNTNNPNASSAAAMDALNLDDLFNDDPNDSFFDDMDLDLGDISGVFNEGASGGGDLLRQEFGRSGSVESSGKRGSKVALTHAQIVANLGIKKDKKGDGEDKKIGDKDSAVDDGPIGNRIRTRREARSSEEGAKSSGISNPKKEEAAAVVVQEKKEITKEELAAMDAVANCGIRPCMQFYPYSRLPVQVEIKKSQKTYPCLEKVHHPSSATEKNKAKDNSASTPNDDSVDKTLLNPNESKTTSPLHILCAPHTGAHVDASEWDKSLLASTHASKLFLDQSHPMLPLLKGELSKLLVIVMKQAAFLRQNLWNMEIYAKNNLSEEEYKGLFPISRKQIEEVLSSIDDRGFKALLPPDPSAPPPQSKDESPSPKKDKGKLNLKPMISVKVKVRVQGWRDKSGRRLVGRLKPPKSWKVAVERAKNLALKRQAEEEAARVKNLPKKPVDPEVLKVVASELLQSHLLKDVKQVPGEEQNSAEKSSSIEKPALVEKQTLSDIQGSEEKQQVDTSMPPPPDKKKTEPPETPKKSTRKRKNTSQSLSSVTDATASVTADLPPITPFFDKFHIPSYKPLHTAILAPPSKTQNESLSRAQQTRILQVLHNKILHPSLSPTERRTILSNEIASTVARLENARMNKQVARAQEIQREIKALEAIHEKDLETVPESGNTNGLWHWLEETSYFCETRKEDVFDGLDFIGGSDSVEVDDEQPWGSLLPPVNVMTAQENGSHVIEQSPLFDCLQSLLVEVDDEGFDDDELLSGLPPFTTDQLLHGPSAAQPDEDDILDVSKLSLDQRTYLQLRAVGLIDTSAIPSKSPRVLEDAPQKLCRSNNLDDTIDKMKSDLIEVESTNTTAASELKRVALAYAFQSAKRRKQVQEEESILSKYNDLQKQNGQGEARRVSGRVKMGPMRFDGENWLHG